MDAWKYFSMMDKIYYKKRRFEINMTPAILMPDIKRWHPGRGCDLKLEVFD
jgi:hypothetical protein